MTDEEKKAIENIKEDIKYADLRDLVDDDCTVCFVEDLETILNLLEKQDNRIKELESDNYECNNIIVRYMEELEFKDKMIELYIEHIYKGCDFDNRIKTKEQIKQYFENKAKESGEIDE